MKMRANYLLRAGLILSGAAIALQLLVLLLLPEACLETPSESLRLFASVLLQQLQAQLEPEGAAMVAGLVDKLWSWPPRRSRHSL
jgi:hypothetical protein